MLSTQTKCWVGNWGSEILSAMADSKKANDKQHKNVTQKTNPWAQAPAVCEKNNFHLFRASASGKYNLE